MNRTRRNTAYAESARKNNINYNGYIDRLTELSISMFDWKNLPDTVDSRFMELTLFKDGQVVFFKDDIIGELALKCTIGGPLSVYGIPINRMAYAVNGYTKNLDDTNSVIIYNNMLHTNSIRDVAIYAEKLYELDRTIEVNAKAQKTPILIQCGETQRLVLKNLYKEYDGNSPVIFGDKNLDINGLKAIVTGAPYVADKLYTLKTQYWNEALTYLGISNVNIQKRERLLSDEVTRNQGGVIASRYSRLESRRQACEKINAMFGLNIECDFKEDYRAAEEGLMYEGETETDDDKITEYV